MTPTLHDAKALLVRALPGAHCLARHPPTLQDIEEAAERCGVVLPEVLKQWLLCCNGACFQVGELLGFRSDRSNIDIETILLLFSEWKDKHWIPVAGDSCSNYYLLLPEGCICFYDTQCDPAEAMYVAASDLAHFLVFFLQRELGQRGWPFDAGYVCGQDPQILQCACAPLPWERD